MSVDSKLLKNTQNSFQWFQNAKKQSGGKGRGYGVNFSSLNNDANSGIGYNRASSLAYNQCGQSGGNGYGFTEQGATASQAFRGSYTPITTYSKAKQCGGKRRSRKSKKRRKSKKGGKSDDNTMLYVGGGSFALLLALWMGSGSKKQN